MKFVPGDHEPEIICEVDPILIFQDTEQVFKLMQGSAFDKTYEFEGISYSVNIGNDRYHIFGKTPQCVCCGLRGNRMFLARYTNHDGKTGFHFRLYAETRDRKDSVPHLVLLTKDHIVSREHGGKDEVSNYQTLCWLCNTVKSVLNVSIDQIRGSMFNIYRIYRGTIALRKTKDQIRLQQMERERVGCLLAVEKIQQGLEKVADPTRRQGMLDKIETSKERAAFLGERIRSIELQAQTTGEVFQLDEA